MSPKSRICLLVLAPLVLALLPWAARAESATDLYRRSYQLETRGDVAGALALVQRVRATSGADYFVLLRTGWLSYLAGRWSDAEAAYRAAMAAAPRSIEAQLGLTLPLVAAKKWRELEKVGRALLKRDPGNATARARLAHALYAQGNYAEAANAYRQLCDDYPAELGYRTSLGWSQYQMGKKDEARKLFDAVLAVAPDDPGAKEGRVAP